MRAAANIFFAAVLGALPGVAMSEPGLTVKQGFDTCLSAPIVMQGIELSPEATTNATWCVGYFVGATDFLSANCDELQNGTQSDTLLTARAPDVKEAVLAFLAWAAPNEDQWERPLFEGVARSLQTEYPCES